MIAGLFFMAGMRRSEVSALRWADVAVAADGDGILVTVRRRSKTNQGGCRQRVSAPGIRRASESGRMQHDADHGSLAG